jgi:hypothetical protein
MHDKLNYPEYNWSFDASTAPGVDSLLSTSDNDPWGKINTTCIGSACCMTGTEYDYSLNKCVPNNTLTSETFINMDNMNQVFTKHTSEFKKPDITMNSKIYPKNY